MRGPVARTGDTLATAETQEVPARSRPSHACFVQLLGGFRACRDGQEIDLPASTWRLVAFLAIAGRPLDRGYVANSLWLDKSDQRAQANLRSCLWRLRQAEPALVACTAVHLRVGEAVRVDLSELRQLARQLRERDDSVELDAIDAHLLCSELLPEWYDDFVELEREQLRQIRLRALEALAARLHLAGRTDQALDVALTAVAAEPLRESAHRLVIGIHLDEGNVSEALRQYHRLCSLLRGQLGVGPSPAAHALIRPWLPLPAPT